MFKKKKTENKVINAEDIVMNAEDMDEEELEEELEEDSDEEEVKKPSTTKVKKPSKQIVVRELPTQEARNVKLDDGSVVGLLTIEEALTKILNILEEN
jgi:hypothetical protein